MPGLGSSASRGSLSDPALLHWFDELPSTQDEAHRLAAEGAPHGTAVAARVQTAGRGTRGRRWASEAGGLWMSVVCRPEGSASLPVAGIRIGLALAELLSVPPLGQSAGPPVRVKWPNDLYLEDRKLGGILCEARWQGDRVGWMVAGIGLNLHNPLPRETGVAAARLGDAGFAAAARELAPPVAQAVALAGRHAGPLDQSELARFAARDWLRGRPVQAPRDGIVEGITPLGRLRIRAPDGTAVELEDSTALRLL